MKLNLMVLVLASVLAFTSCNAQTKKDENKPAIDKKAVVLENIHNRKSVRTFVPRKLVEKSDLETLVRAGMAAPTARNQQPWEFIALSEKTSLDAIAEKMPNQKMLQNCGAAILVCANTEIADDAGFWQQDCSAAIQNILLAVEAMDLGAVWTGGYPGGRYTELQKAFELPETIIPVALIIIGYPEGEQTPKNKWKEERLHWEKW